MRSPERIPTDLALRSIGGVDVPVRREDEKRLFNAARSGDRRARDELIKGYMPLAESLARRYRRASEPREDLEQVACLALVKAVDAFDVDRGTAFSSYAVPCISGAIKRYFRDYGWAVRVPRELQELALTIQRLDDRHFGEAGRHATATELAAAAGVDVEDILEAREAQRALYSDSLDQCRRCEDGDDASLLDTLGESDLELDRAVDRAALDSVLAQLDDRQRLIVELYYRDELTQAEIGRRIGCSQMHVSRLLRNAVAQMGAIAPSENRIDLGRAA
jgi:RNA polymerase sigma-B factor